MICGLRIGLESARDFPLSFELTSRNLFWSWNTLESYMIHLKVSLTKTWLTSLSRRSLIIKLFLDLINADVCKAIRV